MTVHVRQQIRDAAAVALTGLTTTGARVYASRVYPMQDANLPGLRIFTPSETSQSIEMGTSRLRERTLTLVIEACVKTNTGYADTADTSENIAYSDRGGRNENRNERKTRKRNGPG